ncbi:hypothetical protein Glove_276g10 [Diversispora epigaea]|uniref:BTB domain-containing protein n=1 Tax=Diversispora epigaea TaxID=1348612 RepID=A0A397I4S5_9GLOM|nr:hypothetical protein Glove_276g10 [Diversispora epigaea]
MDKRRMIKQIDTVSELEKHHDYNVITEVENNKKSLTAHSNVLKYRSSYFHQELENIQPNENNIKIINISTQIFKVILLKLTILPPRSVLVTELPPRTNEPKETLSTIISEDHAAEISDGFATQTFWNICHGYVRIVVVAKVKGTDEIIGGYNPSICDNTLDGKVNWMETKNSFIFSLKNGKIQN